MARYIKIHCVEKAKRQLLWKAGEIGKTREETSTKTKFLAHTLSNCWFVFVCRIYRGCDCSVARVGRFICFSDRPPLAPNLWFDISHTLGGSDFSGCFFELISLIHLVWTYLFAFAVFVDLIVFLWMSLGNFYVVLLCFVSKSCVSGYFCWKSLFLGDWLLALTLAHHAPRCTTYLSTIHHLSLPGLPP